MRLITREGRAKDAPRAYKEQYFDEGSWARHGLPEEREAIHRQLLECDPTPENVERILNGSWTLVYCDECAGHVEAVVELGQEADYDSATAHVCFPCLQKAAALRAAPKAG